MNKINEIQQTGVHNSRDDYNRNMRQSKTNQVGQGNLVMNEVTKLYLEIGLFKELYQRKIITEREMSLAVSKLEELLREEEWKDEREQKAV